MFEKVGTDTLSTVYRDSVYVRKTRKSTVAVLKVKSGFCLLIGTAGVILFLEWLTHLDHKKPSCCNNNTE